MPVQKKAKTIEVNKYRPINMLPTHQGLLQIKYYNTIIRKRQSNSGFDIEF